MLKYSILLLIFVGCSPHFKYADNSRDYDENSRNFICMKHWSTGVEYFKQESYPLAIAYLKMTLQCDSFLSNPASRMQKGIFKYLYDSYMALGYSDSAISIFREAEAKGIFLDTITSLSKAIFWEKHVSTLRDSIRSAFRWPKDIDKKMSAKITLTVYIDENGNTFDVIIDKVVGDSVFAGVASSLMWKIKWDPAVWRNRPVKSYITSPIYFKSD